jgi:hypothetical protein
MPLATSQMNRNNGNRQKEAVTSKAVATMTDQLHTTHWIITIQPLQDLMMRELCLVLLDEAIGCPSLCNRIVVFRLADRNRIGNIIAHRPYQRTQGHMLLGNDSFLCLFLLVELHLLLQKLRGIFLCLFLSANLFLNRVYLGPDLGNGVLG